MRRYYLLVLPALIACALFAQDTAASDPKQRARYARDLGKGGSEAIPNLAALLSDPDREVRVEAVKSIVSIGTQRSIDPLIQATRDNDFEIQTRATDGIVNFYVPEYVESGLQKFGSAVWKRFDREETRVVDPHVLVRQDAIEAIARLIRGGAGMEVRANAARAAGVLRGKAAVPDLTAALQSKHDALIYESLIALQKIQDPGAGPKAVFLLRDLEERIQVAAIETVALLRTKEAVPDLQKVYNNARNDRVRGAALGALAMLPDESSRPLFQHAFSDKNEKVRAAAGEGFARLKNAADRPSVQSAFDEERKMAPRLADAFALVSLGNVDTSEFAPLTYLVNTLNSRSYKGVAQPYLIELARDAGVRQALYGFLRQGTRDEKIGIAYVLSASGDRASVVQLEALTKDSDIQVTQEAVRALRNLQARLN
jgi:HEAT repeat protein